MILFDLHFWQQDDQKWGSARANKKVKVQVDF